MTQTAKPKSAFPVRGEREPVFTFLREHGWKMSNWSDKFWSNQNGMTLQLYGAGSRARIVGKDARIIVDDALETAMHTLAKVEGR